MSSGPSKRPRDRAGGSAGAARTDVEVLAGRLGVDISSDNLRHALTHRSYAYENGGIPHNERLEFLGDSVLGLVVTDTLFRIHPDLPESQLAKFRAAVVNAKACAEIASELEIGEFMLLGRGEQATGGRSKTSILADAMEAIIGIVHLDLGLDTATELVHRLFDPLIARSAGLGAGLDWKTSLQELCAAKGLGSPEYLIDSDGPDHAKEFVASVRVASVRYGAGSGTSKKDAEQLAAKAAYEELVGQTEQTEAGEDDAPVSSSVTEAATVESSAATEPKPHQSGMSGATWAASDRAETEAFDTGQSAHGSAPAWLPDT